MAELIKTTLATDPNLLSYYQLEGNSTDYKAAHNGTDTSITYSTDNGKYNQGAGFNGTSSQIDLGANPWSNAQIVSGSVACWFKRSSIPSLKEVFFTYAGYLEMWLDTSGFVNVRSDGSGVHDAANSTNMADGNWHLAVLTWDGSNTNLYVDNNAAITVGNAGSPSPDTFPTRHARMGTEQSATTFWYGGAMDDVAIFGNKKLSSAEVGLLYANPPTGGSFLLNFI